MYDCLLWSNCDTTAYRVSNKRDKLLKKPSVIKETEYKSRWYKKSNVALVSVDKGMGGIKTIGGGVNFKKFQDC